MKSPNLHAISEELARRLSKALPNQTGTRPPENSQQVSVSFKLPWERLYSRTAGAKSHGFVVKQGAFDLDGVLGKLLYEGLKQALWATGVVPNAEKTWYPYVIISDNVPILSYVAVAHVRYIEGPK